MHFRRFNTIRWPSIDAVFRTGPDPRRSDETHECNFIHHDFVQFGKQHLRSVA